LLQVSESGAPTVEALQELSPGNGLSNAPLRLGPTTRDNVEYTDMDSWRTRSVSEYVG